MPKSDTQFQNDPARINRHGANAGSVHRKTVTKQVLDMILSEVLTESELKKLPRLRKRGARVNIELAALIQQARKAIIEGDTQAINSMLDSAYGKAVTHVEQKIQQFDEIELHIDDSEGYDDTPATQGTEPPPKDEKIK